MNREPLGVLYASFDEGNRSLLMRTHVGEAKNESGEEFELATNTFSGEPVIACQGRMWSLRWAELIDLAIERGLLGFECGCGAKSGPRADGSPPEGWLFLEDPEKGNACWYCPLCAGGLAVYDESADWVCRVCGCTNECACPGGCSWVEKNLCSACAPEG